MNVNKEAVMSSLAGPKFGVKLHIVFSLYDSKHAVNGIFYFYGANSVTNEIQVIPCI